MEPDYELFQTIGYLNSCGFALSLLFVGVAAIITAARLKKSVGTWIFAVSALVLMVTNLGSTILGALVDDGEIANFVYAAESLVVVGLNLGLLVGAAMIKPLAGGPPMKNEVGG